MILSKCIGSRIVINDSRTSWSKTHVAWRDLLCLALFAVKFIVVTLISTLLLTYLLGSHSIDRCSFALIAICIVLVGHVYVDVYSPQR